MATTGESKTQGKSSDPQSIDTVTSDKTPIAQHVSALYQQTPFPEITCAKCGAHIGPQETCWMWNMLAFCDRRSCKPVRVPGSQRR